MSSAFALGLLLGHQTKLFSFYFTNVTLQRHSVNYHKFGAIQNTTGSVLFMVMRAGFVVIIDNDSATLCSLLKQWINHYGDTRSKLHTVFKDFCFCSYRHTIPSIYLLLITGIHS